jgi:hypothetical protein
MRYFFLSGTIIRSFIKYIFFVFYLNLYTYLDGKKIGVVLPNGPIPCDARVHAHEII